MSDGFDSNFEDSGGEYDIKNQAPAPKTRLSQIKDDINEGKLSESQFENSPVHSKGNTVFGNKQKNNKYANKPMKNQISTDQQYSLKEKAKTHKDVKPVSQSTTLLPKLKNIPRKNLKPYDPVASLPRIPDPLLKEMEQMGFVINQH